MSRNTQLLLKFGIEDFQDMTPKQAIQLTSEIVMNSMEYDYEQMGGTDNSFSTKLTHGFFGNDTQSVPKLLENGK